MQLDTETKPLWTATREAMGKTWTVELWPDDATMSKEGGSELGFVRHSRQVIRLNAAMPSDSRDETALHEILHACANLGQVKMREQDVEVISNILYAFLRGFGLWNEFPWPDREQAEAK